MYADTRYTTMQPIIILATNINHDFLDDKFFLIRIDSNNIALKHAAILIAYANPAC